MVLEESPEGPHNENGNPNVDSEPDVFQRQFLSYSKGHQSVPYTLQKGVG
jgi:hypothetical protein